MEMCRWSTPKQERGVRIDRIHIEGFGVFHDKNINGFQNGINVLYGPNEAGKSTLLDFIRFTLFEYPHWKDDRRPPIAGGEHGGRLFLKDSSDQSFSIYRHGNGKDVSFEQNGNLTDNLKGYRQLIGNASIDLYKNVYAITLDELLHVDQLSDSGMEDRIFSMGMGLAGVDFGKFEKGLISHTESYFKSRGKNQVLIELVDQIRDKEELILALKKKLGEYNRLSSQKEQLENQLEEVQESRQKLSAAKNKLADYSRAYESFVTYQSAIDELKNLGGVEQFPLNLEEYFQEAEKRIKEIKTELNKTEQTLVQLKEELEGIDWNQELSEHIHLLDFFKTNVKLYEEARSSIDQAKEKQKSSNASAATILQRLGKDLNHDQLLAFEGSFELRSAGNETVEKKQIQQRQVDAKNEHLNRLKRDQEKVQSQLEKVDGELKNLTISSDQQRKDAESKRIELDTAFQQALQGSTKSQHTSKTPFLLAVVFLVVGGVLFAINFLAAGIVLGVAVLSLIFISLKNQDTEDTIGGTDANAINKQIEQIKHDIEQYDNLNKEYAQLSQELSVINNEKKTVNVEFESLNGEIEQLEQEWSEKLTQKRLPDDISPQHIGDFLGNIDELKRLQQDSREAEESIRNNEERIQSFEEQLRVIYPTQTSFEPSTIYELIKTMENQVIAQQKREQLISQISRQERELESNALKLKDHEKERDQLLEKANVNSSEEFYTSIEKHKQLTELENQRDQAAKTIKTICGADQLEQTIDELKKYTPTELNTKKETTENEYELIKQQYDEMNRELAAIITEIRHILEPDEMYKLQNEKQSLQEQLKEETKEWLSTKLALEVLSESKQRYEKERQPEVITQTRKYFKSITENAYEDLRISLSDRHVSIIDDRGRHKTVEELSRGTREQLLLALRLGLIEEYEKNAEPLPVALDDIMVNFDVHRAQNLVKVLTDFAKDRQVILFTCHEHTRDLFKEEGATIIDWRN